MPDKIDVLVKAAIWSIWVDSIVMPAPRLRHNAFEGAKRARIERRIETALPIRAIMKMAIIIPETTEMVKAILAPELEAN